MNDNPKTSIFRKESLERLSSPEQLDQLMQVIRPKSWLTIATLGSLFFITLLWSVIGRIPITAIGRGVLVRPDEAHSDELISLTYFNNEDGGDIQPGMAVIIIPDMAGSGQVGGILGRVKEISAPSIDTLSKARQAIEGSGSLQPGAIEVIAELQRDPATSNGYQWTSANGIPLKLLPGTEATTRIILAEKAPITFVFPFLETSP